MKKPAKKITPAIVNHNPSTPDLLAALMFNRDAPGLSLTLKAAGDHVPMLVAHGVEGLEQVTEAVAATVDRAFVTRKAQAVAHIHAVEDRGDNDLYNALILTAWDQTKAAFMLGLAAGLRLGGAR